MPTRLTLAGATAFMVSIATLTAFVVAAPAPKPKGPDGAPLLPPPSTKPLKPDDRAELEAGVAALQKRIDAIKSRKDATAALWPDVQIYVNAVRHPLVYNELIDVGKAKAALAAGAERAKELEAGKAPWVLAGGARGYVSKIDGSVQPYLLALPKDFKPGDARKWRIDIFCHGRGEGLLELSFINGKTAPGTADKPYVPESFFVQPYGRYCCANKFAGEIDLLEILDSLKKQYPIDEDRVVLTGFSMGGAAVWHLAVHYADLWCAASPGAGFCETKIYQNLAAKGELATTPWWEQALWGWYDAPDYVMNLADVPLIAYAGTEDPQQQSGTIMEKAAADVGIKMQRIWGQNVPHKYEPKAKAELEQRLTEYAAKGRDPSPRQVKLETRTLRYNQMFWLSVDGLERHWKQTVADGRIDGDTVKLQTRNVTALTLTFPIPGPAGADGPKTVEIDGTKLAAPKVDAVVPSIGRAWTARFVSRNGQWQELTARGDDPELRKRHGLQGPIDDAFLDTFLMVRPTGAPMNEAVGKWATSEMAHAVRQWHNIFRGDAPLKADADVSDADIASSNLVLWGDPSSNKVLAKIADKLPIKWTRDGVTLGSRHFDAATHVPILIYPNPLNPQKYVVLNSGFTFREDANGTNSRQVPRLPDYAVIDVTTPPNAHNSGKIDVAGFFGERWELRDDDGKIEP